MNFLLPSLLLFSAVFVTIEKNDTPNKPKTKQPKTKPEIVMQSLKNGTNKDILVVAHRGVWTYAPENSLLAVEKAIQLGIDIVEIDVRMTKDGHLVVIHDETVDRTTNGKGYVHQMTLEEIRKLRLKNACGIQGARQQVPTLEEVMLTAKNKIVVNLDKTESEIVREAFDILKKTGTIQQSIFKGSLSYEGMKKKYAALMDSIIYMPKIGYKLQNIKQYVDEYETGLSPFLYEIVFEDTVSAAYNSVAYVRKNKRNVMAIALWESLTAGHSDELALMEGPEKAYGWLIQRGVNAIMTDRPIELLAYLRNKKLHQ